MSDIPLLRVSFDDYEALRRNIQSYLVAMLEQTELNLQADGGRRAFAFEVSEMVTGRVLGSVGIRVKGEVDIHGG